MNTLICRSLRSIRIQFTNTLIPRAFYSTSYPLESNEFLQNTETEKEFQVEEHRINVPWGHLAAKWWGPKNVRPIVALHGWQDNAGTFDKLIPFLPKHVGYLCIDWPGHGLSSRLPDGLQYTTFQNIHLLYEIKQHLKWDKLSLLTHSMSAFVANYYSGLFPEHVDMLVSIDFLKPIVPKSTRRIDEFRKWIGHEFTVVDHRNRMNMEPPCYTYEDIIKRWVKGTRGSVTTEGAKYLARRSINRSIVHPEKFFFTRDSRLKYFQFCTMPQEISTEIGRKINAPHLFIKAKKAEKFEKQEHIDEAIREYHQSNPLFEHHFVDGTHHIHLTEPHKVSEIISDFILKNRTE